MEQEPLIKNESLPTILLEETFWKTENGSKLWTRAWKGSSKPKGLVFFCHGLHAHSSPEGRPGLGKIFNKFVKEGEYYVFAVDHVGHGQTEGIKGLIENSNTIKGDFLSYIKKVKADYLEIPFLIIGESMGGLLSVLTGIVLSEENFPDFKGLILIAPAIHSDIKPSAPVVAILRGLTKIGPLWGLGPGLDVNLLWRDKSEIELAMKDKLRYTGRIRLQTGMTLLELESDVNAKGRIESINFPFLCLHGDKDRTIPVSASELLINLSKSTDKKLIIYPGAPHELLHDQNSDQVINDIFEWAKEHLK
jgi:acylglycerol lipase